MYASAHWDLVREAQTQRLRDAAVRTPTGDLPAAPGRITVWGPRASMRVAAAAATPSSEEPSPTATATATERTAAAPAAAAPARTVEIPAPRSDRAIDLSDALLLDA
jgi:hypothetical protein